MRPGRPPAAALAAGLLALLSLGCATAPGERWASAYEARLSGHAQRPAIVDGTLTGSSLWTGGVYGLESSIWAIGMAAILSGVLIAIAIRRRVFGIDTQSRFARVFSHLCSIQFRSISAGPHNAQFS